jgi:hypothetical protein
MRFVSFIQRIALGVYRSTFLRKVIRHSLKVAATTIVAILTILASIASIWSAALATQNADGPKVLIEIPKQFVSFPEEFGEFLEKAQLALDKYLEE